MVYWTIMVYYIFIGITVVIVAFFMAATQKARGYNFWRYFIVSIVVVAGIYMMIENLVLNPK
ncbi:MAG: hypothetical protein ABF238_03035 [Flavobacteriales bacterium]